MLTIPRKYQMHLSAHENLTNMNCAHIAELYSELLNYHYL